jgi:predicted solute-binding protein
MSKSFFLFFFSQEARMISVDLPFQILTKILKKYPAKLHVELVDREFDAEFLSSKEGIVVFLIGEKDVLVVAESEIVSVLVGED